MKGNIEEKVVHGERVWFLSLSLEDLVESFQFVTQSSTHCFSLLSFELTGKWSLMDNIISILG